MGDASKETATGVLGFLRILTNDDKKNPARNVFATTAYVFSTVSACFALCDAVIPQEANLVVCSTGVGHKCMLFAIHTKRNKNQV